MAELREVFIESPVGTLRVSGEEAGVRAVSFTDARVRTPDSGIPASLRPCVEQLREYFEGTRREFDLRLAPEGTDFQKRVWAELVKVPFGRTATYGEIAKRLGDKNAVRAVGLANGQNPIAVVVPCHRVVGSDGSLTGYAGGLERKRWLLDHEREHSGAPRQATLDALL